MITAPRLEDPDQVWEEWLGELTKEDRSSLEKIVENGPRFTPNKGPQNQAYFSKAKVVGYGGAAGGGKSSLIAGLAVNEHTRTVIYRADAKQVSGLVTDMVDFNGGSTGLNRGDGVFRMGHKRHQFVEWGGIEKPGSEKAWQGRAHDLLAVDEATEIDEGKFRWLMGWNRSADPNQRCRAILTFNPPGGPEDASGGSGRWVIDYFAPWIDENHPNPAAYGEIRYFYRNAEGTRSRPMVRNQSPKRSRGGK